MSTLQIRLKNCIQTILDLEPDMRAGIWGDISTKSFPPSRTICSAWTV